MRNLSLIALIPLVACAPGDLDGDGVDYADDCNDSDASIYPGAVETPGDGVDSDCDGADPSFAFVGDWDLDDVSMKYDGYEIFDEGVVELRDGEMVLTPVSAEIRIEAEEGELLEWYFFTADIDPSADGLSLEAEMVGLLTAEFDDEPTSTPLEIECEVDEDDLVCEGELLFDGAPWDVTLEFSR